MKKRSFVTIIFFLAVTLLGSTAWAALTQTQVSQLYVGVFGRASEGGGNSYWQNDPSSTSMTVTANVMLNTEPAKAYFGATLYDNRAFIEHIYFHTLGKTYTEDPDGVDYWVGELYGGKSKGEVIAALIVAAQLPENAGAAQDQFNNKVQVSNYCADRITDYTDLDTFTGFIAGVTDDEASVMAAIELINQEYEGLNGGQTGPFTMTGFFPLTGSWETDQWTLFFDLRDHEINGVATRAMANTADDPSVAYWTNDENGLRLHGYMEEDGELEIFPLPIIFADSVVNMGDKKEGTYWLDEEEKITISIELVAVEDVSVPAGNFPDCLKFTVFGYPSDGNPDDYGKETIWFAEGVGFVKAQTDANSDVFIFADNGETRQLLNYHITPSDLTEDELAIRAMYQAMCDYDEAENLAGDLSLISDNYFDRQCRTKADIEVDWGNWFDNYSNIKEFATLEEVTIDGDDAFVLKEDLLTYVDDGSGERYWDWGRQLRRFKKEAGVWKYYGVHLDFKLDWYNVWTRNTVDGGYFALSAGFRDCDGNMIDPTGRIASLKVTGPPGTFTDLDLTQGWDPEWLEYWYSEDIANIKNGFYTLEVVDDAGNIFVTTDYLQIMPLLDVPHLIFPVDGILVPPGNVTLDWADVDQADYYRVELERWDGGNWIRENKYPSESEVVFNALAPETDFRWRIRARQEDIYGEYDNESRCGWRYFSTASYTNVVSFDYAHLQYRTYEDGRHAYRGWVDFTRGAEAISSGDITQLVLKDGSGQVVPIGAPSFYSSDLFYYRGYPNGTTGEIEYSQGSPYGGFSIGFPDGTALLPGAYTYEATTIDDDVLTYTVYYPGDTTIPVVASSSINYEGKADGSLELTWTNPPGTYDQIRVNFYDQDWNDLLLVRLGVNAETVTIPGDIIDSLETRHPFTSVKLEIQTRLHGGDGHNYARGISDAIEIN